MLYPHVAPKQATDGGRLAEKVPAIMTIAERGYDFVAEVAPQPGDVLIPKKHPSAFFATPLASHLIDLQADTLVVTGCTTSGCVRGSVVDAFAFNFRVLVAEDAVYDRSRVSHAVNLFDMSEKYADVAPTREVIARLQAIRTSPAREDSVARRIGGSPRYSGNGNHGTSDRALWTPLDVGPMRVGTASFITWQTLLYGADGLLSRAAHRLLPRARRGRRRAARHRAAGGAFVGCELPPGVSRL